MLSTCLDIFEARMPFKTVGQDFGLLQAIDERLAMYGWLTNTGIKIVIIVDMEGRISSLQDNKNPAVLGLKNADFTPVNNEHMPGVTRPDTDDVTGVSSSADGLHPTPEKPLLHAR